MSGTRAVGRRKFIPLIPLLPLIPLPSCKLTEITVPVGQERIIVQSVLSRAAGSQFAVVERSVTGESGAAGSSSDAIPPDGPGRPIENAVVVLEFAGGTACGPASDTLFPIRAGLYQAAGVCTPDPGDVVALRVVTLEGAVVTGRTTVPGARRVSVAAAGVVVPADFSLNRDHDTLDLSVDAIVGRALQVEIRKSAPAIVSGLSGDDLVFYLVTDSLGLRIPGDLINPFEGDEGEVILRGGVVYDLAVVLTDTNYYDFVRSRSDPLTGRGYINRLEGGIGVFGSVETHHYGMRVTGDVDRPGEGLYQLRGTVGGRTVDVTWELYADALEERQFAAFIRGSWYDGQVDGSVEGFFGVVSSNPASFEATFTTVADTVAGVTLWMFQGARASPGTSFTVSVRGGPANGPLITGSLSAVQLTGPGAQGASRGGPDVRRRRP